MAIDDPRDDTVLESIAFTGVEGLLVLCHSSASPSDEEWDAWIARESRGDHRGILISTEGGAPNSRQRSRVADKTGNRGSVRPPVALLTDSAIIRSVMTAFAWILGKDQPMKAFPRTALDEAVAWLGADVRPAPVRAAVSRLQVALSRAPSRRFSAD
jgi:hypothetical protein